MKFCDVCQNMMYVRVDDDNSLNTYCKNCGFTSVPTVEQQDRIFNVTRANTDDRASYRQYLTPDIRFDNTLPRTRRLTCPNPQCPAAGTKQGTDVIYIKYDDVHLKFLYHCCTCATFWTADSASGTTVVPALDKDDGKGSHGGAEGELGVGDADREGQVAGDEVADGQQ